MYINLIIEQRLPMQSRIRALASIPRTHRTRAISSKLHGMRNYVTGSMSTVHDSLTATHKPDSIPQEHVRSAFDKNAHDIQSEYVREAKVARESADNYSIDAASQNLRLDPKDKTQGNPEGMGMLEQVGSATGTAKFFDDGGIQGLKTS